MGTNNFLKKYRKAWSVIIFIVLMSGVYYFIVKALLASIESKNNGILQVAAIREYRRERISQLQKFRSQQEIIDRDAAKIPTVISQSDKESVKGFIESIEKLAELTNTRYETISLSEKVEKTKAGSSKKKSSSSSKNASGIWSNLPEAPYIRLEIRAVGAYVNVYDFLKKIENMPYLLDVVELKIYPTETKSQNQSVSQRTSAPIISKNTTGSTVEKAANLKGEEVELMASLVVYTDKTDDKQTEN